MSDFGEVLEDPISSSLANATQAHYQLAETSTLAGGCFEDCSPEDVMKDAALRAALNFCKTNATKKGGQQEQLVEVEIKCDGMRRSICRLGGKVCGAKVNIESVTMPTNFGPAK